MNLELILKEENNKKLKLLVTQYLKKDNVLIENELFNIRKERFINKNIMYLYKELINKKSDNQSFLRNIDLNIGIFHKMDIDDIYNLFVDCNLKEKGADFFDDSLRKITENHEYCWRKIFNCLVYNKKDEFDLCKILFADIISSYSLKDIESIILSKKEWILICQKLNYMMTIYHQKVIEMFNDISDMNSFNETDYAKFLNKYLFNYPHEIKKYIKKKEKTIFVDYLSKFIVEYDKQNEIKHSFKDFEYSLQRINIYGKRQHKQSQEIMKLSKEKSILGMIGNNNTILFGKTITYVREGMIQTTMMQSLEYNVSMPMEYLIDPVYYFEQTERIMKMKIGDEL